MLVDNGEPIVLQSKRKIKADRSTPDHLSKLRERS
jgi:hypothetical protein